MLNVEYKDKNNCPCRRQRSVGCDPKCDLYNLGGEVNILVNKTIYASNNPNEAIKMIDGDTESCMDFEEAQLNWVVIDLENQVEINKVEISSRKSLEPLSVFIGDYFQPCQFYKQYKRYRLCKAGIIQNEERIEVDCDKKGNRGQYLALVKERYSFVKTSENLVICELKAFGKIISTVVKKVRPKIINEQIPSISINDFKISKEIRQGVSGITVPVYSQSFNYINNCQPLIWDQESLNVFSVACETNNGKSRLVTFGRLNFFRDLPKSKQDEQLYRNILKWLSPNSLSPSVIGKSSITSIKDLKEKVKQYDILDFNIRTPYPDEVLNEIFLMVQNGTLAIVVDWTFFVGTSKEAKNSYMKIFNLFNIDFNDKFITESERREFLFNTKDFNENALSVDLQIARLKKNHDYFIKNGKMIGEKLSSLPFSILQKSNIKTNLEEIILKYNELITYICPCKAAPSSDPNDRKLIEIFISLIKSQSLVNSNYKLPCIDSFPGDFEKVPVKKIVTLFLKGDTESTDNPIGYYLEAGSTLKYEINMAEGSWSISVGCHSDILDERRTDWFRYPDIFVGRIDLTDKGEVYSPFGGTLWLYNEKVNQSLNITLSNIVATPFFNLRSKNAALEWNEQKKNPGLWSQIAGDNIVFCEASNKIKDFSGDYLERLMKNNWDKLIKMDYSIKKVNWRTKRPEKVVLDIMTRYGYGHSGYPIVVWDSWYKDIFNESFIFTEGSWGMCHEIGHNMQESVWTFEDVDEVTNNVFCLFNYDKLWRIPRFGFNQTLLKGNENEIQKHLDGVVDYNGWKSSPWISLSIYSQMATHFGWGFYKRVFDYYKNNINSFSTDKEKISMWINVTSKISKQNLLPIFEFWGVSIDNLLVSEVSKLPCFFPNDFFTRMSSKRSNYVMKKYKNCNRVSLFYEDYDPTKDIEGMRANFLQELSSKIL